MGDSHSPSFSSSFLPTPHPKKACSLPSLFLCIQQRPWLQVPSLISGILGCPVLKFWHSEMGEGQRNVSLASCIGTSFTPLQMVSCVVNAVVPVLCSEMSGRELMEFSGTITLSNGNLLFQKGRPTTNLILLTQRHLCDSPLDCMYSPSGQGWYLNLLIFSHSSTQDPFV